MIWIMLTDAHSPNPHSAYHNQIYCPWLTGGFTSGSPTPSRLVSAHAHAPMPTKPIHTKEMRQCAPRQSRPQLAIIRAGSLQAATQRDGQQGAMPPRAEPPKTAGGAASASRVARLAPLGWPPRRVSSSRRRPAWPRRPCTLAASVELSWPSSRIRADGPQGSPSRPPASDQ